MQLRAWTTIFILSSSLLIACGDNSEGGDSAGSDAAAAGGDGGSGDDGGDGETADAAPFAGITCGESTCDEADEVCCAGEGGLDCAAECDTVSFACDGPEDCPAADDVCCGSGADGTQCTMQDDCGGGGEGKFICHGAEDCPEAGDECCMPAEAMVGVCRANCGGPG